MYHYRVSCVHSTAELIQDMTDDAKQITWRTFRQHVPWQEVQALFPFYSYQGERYNPMSGELTAPFHIKDDWAVSFWKSSYGGEPCYYIVHSGIEYVFTRQDDYD